MKLINIFNIYHLPLKKTVTATIIWQCINISSRSLITRVKLHHQDLKAFSWFGVLFTAHTQHIGL